MFIRARNSVPNLNIFRNIISDEAGTRILGIFKGTAAPYSVFVEEVEDHVGQTRVAPVSMNQEELLQVLKARKSEIAGHHRLHTQ